MIVLLFAAVLAAITGAAYAVLRKFRENGGYWFYLQHDNAPRRHRKCRTCAGTGALVLRWNSETGTTHWIAPPVEERGWTDKDGDGKQGGRIEADSTNSKRCPDCLTLGRVWVSPQNPGEALHIPTRAPGTREIRNM